MVRWNLAKGCIIDVPLTNSAPIAYSHVVNAIDFPRACSGVDGMASTALDTCCWPTRKCLGMVSRFIRAEA